MLPPEFRLIAEKIGFTEGPVWTSRGELFVTSMSRGLVYELAPDLTLGSPISSIETGGGPNGLAEGRDGRIYVAQNGNATMTSRSDKPVVPGIQSFGPEGVQDHTDQSFAAPNDIALGPDGSLWFTDPDSNASRSNGGLVWRLPADGSSCRPVITDLDFPNGLAFGIDPTELFIADTAADQIVRFRVVDDVPTDRTHFADSPGGPDGIAFDRTGNLYVAAFDADEVQVFDPSGVLSRTLSTGPGSRPTNLCFAGEADATLVVTLASGGRIVALNEILPGINPTDIVGSS